MREIIRHSTLAASGHNAQPWLFEISEGRIEIYPDYSRKLPSVDPQNRELWISLGCALENLCIAAKELGYDPQISYPLERECIRVDIYSMKAIEGSPFESIPLRQNTRTGYDRQKVDGQDLIKVEAIPLEQGIVVEILDSDKKLEKVLEYVHAGNLVQIADSGFREELIHWIRFNKRESLASLDGLDSRCLGLPPSPRWIGEGVMRRTSPDKQATSDAKLLRSSAGVIVISSDSDSKSSWVRTGQVYQRLALMLTSLNIKSAFLNQPIEVPLIRTQFQSLRREVDDVIRWL